MSGKRRRGEEAKKEAKAWWSSDASKGDDVRVLHEKFRLFLPLYSFQFSKRPPWRVHW